MFFVDFDYIEDIKTEYEIGTVIDLTKEQKGEDASKAATKIYDILEKYSNIKALIIKTWYSKVAENMLKDFEDKGADIFFQFTDEEEHLEEIVDLKSSRVLGNQSCTDETQVLHYLRYNITNMFITPPICNDFGRMRKIVDNGATLFLAANVNRFADSIDSQWVRPEGIRLIEPVCKNFLLKGYHTNINNIVAAYINGQALDSLPDLIYNLYIPRDINLLPEEFDIKRLRCGGQCLTCNRCKQFIETYHKLLELDRKEDDYEHI